MASIYIIDDEETIQYLYREGLALEGHNIVGSAPNGKQAIEEIENFKSYPDIIILDHRMPIKNGIETLRELKDHKFLPFSNPACLFASETKNRCPEIPKYMRGHSNTS